MAVLAYPFPVPLYCHVHGILVVSSPSQVRAHRPKRPRAELTFDMDIAEVVYFNDKYDNNKFTAASKRILRARRVRIRTNILEEKCNELLVVTALLEMSCKISQGVPKACKILTSSCKLLEHLARSYKTFLVGRSGHLHLVQWQHYFPCPLLPCAGSPKLDGQC